MVNTMTEQSKYFCDCPYGIGAHSSGHSAPHPPSYYIDSPVDRMIWAYSGLLNPLLEFLSFLVSTHDKSHPEL